MSDQCEACGYYWKAHPPSGDCPGPRRFVNSGVCIDCEIHRMYHVNGECPPPRLTDPAESKAPPVVETYFDYLRRLDDEWPV